MPVHPGKRVLFLYNHNKSNTMSKRCKWTHINSSFAVQASMAMVWNPFHTWSKSTGLPVLCLNAFPALFLVFAIFYLHNHDLWSRLSLFPLVNALKHELIIRKAICSVTSCYINISAPVPGSVLFFFPLSSSPFHCPYFSFNVKPVALYTFTSKSVKDGNERSLILPPLPLLCLLSH